MCHPRNLGRKALNMVLLHIEQALRDKHRKIYILHSRSLEPLIHLLLDQLPDCVACGLEHHASLYAGVVHKLSLLNYIRVPLCKIHLHGCNRFYKFLLCHLSLLLLHAIRSQYFRLTAIRLIIIQFMKYLKHQIVGSLNRCNLHRFLACMDFAQVRSE